MPEHTSPGGVAARSRSSSCSVLEPGAAHTSSTLWCEEIFRSRAGIMEASSCRTTWPSSTSLRSSADSGLSPSFFA
eukprot:CAMPEP_0173219670 /NCGR_PEP_ID=MMETSP1142-20121109/1725_1 /TAXON_ID=483371 /ORGANISM="non described non described, Strain CCMP2298" /LENGTH=75 /DNA_ID=CAMNT_0014147477 /DNA_START=154 /DNA_END=378 /DNA_ORIENTATION=+